MYVAGGTVVGSCSREGEVGQSDTQIMESVAGREAAWPSPLVSEVTQSCPTLCDPMETRLLRPWDFLGKSTRVGCRFRVAVKGLWQRSECAFIFAF